MDTKVSLMLQDGWNSILPQGSLMVSFVCKESYNFKGREENKFVKDLMLILCEEVQAMERHENQLNEDYVWRM